MSLRLGGVHKAFGTIRAVSGVNLDVAPGEFFALLGPSGCGKTTLLRIIAGIYPVDAGQVALKERDITRLPMHRRNLAMVFQNYALFPHLTVFENVAFGLRSRNVRGEDLKRRVMSALGLVRLEALAERQPSQLSGGQQQRVALARAVAVEPDLLLLDEPLSNLDARLRDDMRAEIRDLQRRLGITTVFVTHDIGEAFAMADRIAVMQEGKVLQVGRAKDIYEQPANRFVARFLGPVNEFSVLGLEPDPAGPKAQLGGGLSVRLKSDLVHQASDARGLWLVLRPESLVIEPRDGEADNTFTGTLEDLVFLGGNTECRVRLKEARLNALCPSARVAGLKPGTEVRVGWRSQEGVLVRD